MNEQRLQRIGFGLLALIAAIVVVAQPSIAVAENGDWRVVDEAVEGIERGLSNADLVAQDRQEGAGDSDTERTAQEPADGADEAPVRPLPERERTLPGGQLAVIGYIALWLMLGVYLFYILRRQRRLQDEIDALDDRITDAFSGETDAEVDS